MKHAIAPILALLIGLLSGGPQAVSAARLAARALDCLGTPPAVCRAAAVLPGDASPDGRPRILLLSVGGEARCFAAEPRTGRRLRLSPRAVRPGQTGRWIPVSKARLLTGILLDRAGF